MGELMAKHMWNERSQEVAADTKKYVRQIAARYKSAYTYCILQQMRKNLSGKNEQTLLLEQRKWHSYNRPLQSGYLYVLGGSEHRKWRRRFCVLQSDYTLEVYDTEEDFEVANKPRYCRKFSNFKVIDNVDAHFAELVKDYLRDFGFVRDNVSHIIKKLGSPSDPSKRPTQHVLALYHRHKGRFYMAADSAVEKDKWMKSMQDAERQLSGVHCETQIQREAFEFTIQQACDAEEHCGITVNMSGTQEEVTSEFIADYLSNGCKTMLQTKVSGDACKKFKMWEAISKTLTLSVENIVSVEYPPLRKKAEEEAEQLKQRMLLSMPRINAVYETASVEILAVLDCNFKEDLYMKILPKIPELVTRMGELLSVPLREVRDLFVSLAESVLRQTTTTSTEFANNIDRFFLNHLDFAPRNPEVMHITFQAAIGKKSPLLTLSETFPKLNYIEQETKLCLLLQTVLDSAICTFESLCGEAVQKNEGHLKPTNITKIQGRVLKKLDHDNIVLTKQFLKELTLKITYSMLQHVIRYDVRNKLRDHEDLIPTELKEFLPIANVFRDSVLEKIEEELQPSISAAFKRLAKDHFRISRYHSSSTINSHSSNASDDTNTTPKHESLSKQASSSDSSPIQKSSPIVNDLQGVENIETTVENINNEDEPVNEGNDSTALPVCMDGETGEPCNLVDEYGEPLPAPKKKNDVDISETEGVSTDAENKSNNEENVRSEDTVNTNQQKTVEDQDVVEGAVVNNVTEDEQKPEEVEDRNSNIDKVESPTSEEGATCVVKDAVAKDEQKPDEIDEENSTVEEPESLSAEGGATCDEKDAVAVNEVTDAERRLDEVEDENPNVEEAEPLTLTQDPTCAGKDEFALNKLTGDERNSEDIEVERSSAEEVESLTSKEDVKCVVEDSQEENKHRTHLDENGEEVQENIEHDMDDLEEENGESTTINPISNDDIQESLADGASHENMPIDHPSSADQLHDDLSQENQNNLHKNHDDSHSENPANDKPHPVVTDDEVSQHKEEHDEDGNSPHETQNAEVVEIEPNVGQENREEKVSVASVEERQDENTIEEHDANGVLPSNEDESDEAPPDKLSNNEEKGVEDHCQESDKEVIMSSLKPDEQHQDKESNSHQANGKINQNGVSKISSDVDDDTPSVPARHKKHSTEDKKEEPRNTAEEKNEIPACVINDDMEYNGVIEQIIHTGEEKLI